MDKKPWQSKTLWVALVVAVAAFVPAVSEFVTKNPEFVGMALGLVFAALRVITKGSVVIE